MVTRPIAALRSRALRLGLAVTRRARPRTEGDDLGLLLSPERRGGSVVLVWALGELSATDRPVRLDAALEAFDTAVFVTDGLDFRGLVEAGRLFEAIPGPALRAAAPGRDWPRYLARRIDRIRRSWQPDFEVVLGQSPDAFIEAAGGGREAR
jgi:hypothetical protein